MWSETVGWLNFAPTHGGVTEFPTHLSGFAWSENVGWINFDPSDGQVTIAGADFGGYACSENLGWIHFGNAAAGYGARLVLSLIEIPTLGSWGLAALGLLLAALAPPS